VAEQGFRGSQDKAIFNAAMTTQIVFQQPARLAHPFFEATSMQLEQLFLFTTVTLVVSASPGPVMLNCMADAGRYGFAHSLHSMLGASLGNLLLMLLSALGVGLLVEESSWIFRIVQWLGAAYLIYLGIKLMLAAPLQLQLDPSAPPSENLVRKSFLIAVTNPKGLIYFGALFPQFIDLHQSLPPQFALLSLVFLIMDFIWMAIYAQGGKLIMRWLKTPRHQRWFNWCSGGALVATGLALSRIYI
jgi:homoserine/homoserine lactone efflux protein